MHAFILQDWITVRGQSTQQTVTQGEDGWLDLEAYQDVIFWVDCRELTGTTVTLNLQTAPSKDESMFAGGIMSGALLAVGSSATLIKVILAASPSIPLARFVRWQLVGPSGTAWDTTLRLLVAANSPGA